MSKWKNMRRLTLLVVLAQTIVLLGMIGQKQYTLKTGTEVVLKLAEPVDPRDLFRGVYANLEFRVSRLDLYHTLGDLDYEEYDPVWVVLMPPKGTGDRKDIYWRATSFHPEQPKRIPEGAVILRGEVDWVRDSTQWRYNDVDDLHVRVTYHIENYFLPEHDPDRIANLREKGTVAFKVAVDRFGKAAILAVLVDGEERYREGLF